jgi:glyoxylase-like metal-dependent hydrolase (beta-lactamase superfamily II)
MSATLHWKDTNIEVHKVVVGPFDNNVFVIRCTATGEAVLIDAANEHEQLLELCRALGVRRVLETHGHWDHIQAVPAMREAGYEVAVTALDAPRLKDVGYDVFIDDAEVIEVGKLPFTTLAIQKALSRSLLPIRRCCSLETRCFQVAQATPRSRVATLTPSFIR